MTDYITLPPVSISPFSSVTSIPLDDPFERVVPSEFVVPGNDGKSAYELAVEGGFVGTEAQWLDSLGNRSFVHVQSTPSSYWSISHSLGRPPAVSLLSDTGEEFDADVTATSTNVFVQLPSPISGQAILT